MIYLRIFLLLLPLTSFANDSANPCIDKDDCCYDATVCASHFCCCNRGMICCSCCSGAKAEDSVTKFSCCSNASGRGSEVCCSFCSLASGEKSKAYCSICSTATGIESETVTSCFSNTSGNNSATGGFCNQVQANNVKRMSNCTFRQERRIYFCGFCPFEILEDPYQEIPEGPHSQMMSD